MANLLRYQLKYCWRDNRNQHARIDAYYIGRLRVTVTRLSAWRFVVSLAWIK